MSELMESAQAQLTQSLGEEAAKELVALVLQKIEEGISVKDLGILIQEKIEESAGSDVPHEGVGGGLLIGAGGSLIGSATYDGIKSQI